MKKLVYVTVMFTLLTAAAPAQVLPKVWSDSERGTMINFSVGLDYGATAHIGITHPLNWITPGAVSLDWSVPMGAIVFDDMNLRLGGIFQFFESGGFSGAVKLGTHYRTHQTILVTISGFAADAGILAGYSSPDWSVAGETGFEWSVLSRIQHSSVMHSMNPSIRDGWYPNTAGHYYFGLSGSVAVVSRTDVTMRLGAVRSNDSISNPVLPFYMMIGIQRCI